MKNKVKVRYAVLLVPTLIFAVVLILGILDGNAFIAALTSTFELVMQKLGWVVSITSGK